MIEYKFPEEKDILFHYAELLNNDNIKNILSNGHAQNRTEAEELTQFYWAMEDKAVEDKGQGVPVIEQEGVEVWMEYIFHSLNGYMVSNGYIEEWDRE